MDEEDINLNDAPVDHKDRVIIEIDGKKYGMDSIDEDGILSSSPLSRKKVAELNEEGMEKIEEGVEDYDIFGYDDFIWEQGQDPRRQDQY